MNDYLTITNAIIGITLLITYLSFQNSQTLERLLHIPYRVKHHKEYYRLISSGFIHGSWTHFFFNMFTLYFLGPEVEYKFMSIFGVSKGAVLYILLYLSSIVFANLPSQLKHGDNSSYRALGASGAVSAVLLASVIYFPLQKLYIYGILPLQSWILAILYMAYSSYAAKNNDSRIGHDAHFAGALYAILFIAIIDTEAIGRAIRMIVSSF